MSTPARQSSFRNAPPCSAIELGLQRFLVFLAVRTVTGPLSLELHGRALCAVCLDRYITNPFGNAPSWFLHCLIFRSFDHENN
jgi:hypothetical protein